MAVLIMRALLLGVYVRELPGVAAPGKPLAHNHGLLSRTMGYFRV